MSARSNHPQSGHRSQRTGPSWRALPGAVKREILDLVKDGRVDMGHFDEGVLQRLQKLNSTFGTEAALAAIASIAPDLANARKKPAFLMARLNDCFKNLENERVWAEPSDPQASARRWLLPDQYEMVESLVLGRRGLAWHHFYRKVLDIIRERGVETVIPLLQQLSASQLQGVRDVPAYIYTLLGGDDNSGTTSAPADDAAYHTASHGPQGRLNVRQYSDVLPPPPPYTGRPELTQQRGQASVPNTGVANASAPIELPSSVEAALTGVLGQILGSGLMGRQEAERLADIARGYLL